VVTDIILIISKIVVYIILEIQKDPLTQTYRPLHKNEQNEAETYGSRG